jgi:S-adenosylmethionine hydrolase
MNRIAPASRDRGSAGGRADAGLAVLPRPDVLTPAAAHLAAGADLAAVGDAFEPSRLVELVIPEPTVEHGKIECEVLDLNRFGNVLLNVRETQLAEAGLDRAEEIQVDATSGSGRAAGSRPTQTSNPATGASSSTRADG